MATITSSPTYNPWAKIYNDYWGLEYCRVILPAFEQLLQQYNVAQGANILDLCCGTGHITQHLIEQGYQVTGLDISEGMLQYARENAPKAKLILDDAKFFNLPSTFDAVISANAGLNEIINFEDLQQVFAKVYDSLLNNGVFLFGLNLEDFYKSWHGAISDGDIKDDLAWACCDSYNPEEKIGQFRITIFQMVEESWQRLDINNQVRGYSRTEVVTALESVGFTDINIYDEEGNTADSQYNRHAIFSVRK
ncbi:class I SAM-dependent DNA methyltransferase [aff. Roholtiella sp. LEGE 12411]|uniref:class I SAM-dependent DNA methyltransferase n=1 Tax=aff. Roholtiella sp. LEGE 12411 TaxID=1828822 RepID=UPI0018804D9B|nr:class I SAM-dependent methyltransferase [aff. Roholtiella sp. LEGE 12411]MBE9034054.1 class I SAM-dependent methyltransferase [aff. Roholtiella sp. LEGE 12411]